MKKLLSFLLIMGLAMPVVGQVSPFLDFGKSGLALMAGPEVGNTFFGATAKIGGSIKGIIDLEGQFYYDIYDQEANDLLNKNATSPSFIGSVTWWFIRKQPIPMVDFNVGLLGVVDYSTFKDYDYAQDKSYKGYMGGLIGFETRVKFRLTDKLALLPGYVVGFDFGNDKDIVNNQSVLTPYAGVFSNLGISLARSCRRGDSFVVSVNQYFDTYESINYYDLTLGYILPIK